MFRYKRHKELYRLCIQDNIPIVRRKTIKYIINLINKNNFQSALEIGTAYGFSTYLISTCKSIESIITIEKNEHSYQIALKYNQSNKIHFLNQDVFDYTPSTNFDFIFIDGPKSHQKDLIYKYIEFLNPNGVIIIDNLLLKKIRNKKNKTKDNIKLLNKVDELKYYLETQNDFNFKFLNFDDGIGVITKHD